MLKIFFVLDLGQHIKTLVFIKLISSMISHQSSSRNTTNIHYADDISDYEPSSDDEDDETLYALY